GLIAPTLLTILYGDRFIPSVLPFRILLAGSYVMGIWVVTSNYLSGKHGYPASVLIVTALAAALNLGLGVAWIPPYAAVGGAACWSAAYAVASLLGVFFFLRDAGSELRVVDLLPRFGDLKAAWDTMMKPAKPAESP